MIRKITNGKIITDTLNEGKNLYFDDKVIIDITEKDLPADEVIDAKGNYVSAGFIDIHTHGGGGSEFMDGSKEAVIDACRIHLTHGTTSIYPTTLASSPDILFEALHDIKEAMENEPDDVPHIMGAHLEGPYFSLNQSGA
ncbi:MAG: amidohydrolase family protein, partial [Clostridia bacterium]|nr:amidohydrolase family protein [Clostridia bacterium]